MGNEGKAALGKLYRCHWLTEKKMFVLFCFKMYLIRTKMRGKRRRKKLTHCPELGQKGLPQAAPDLRKARGGGGGGGGTYLPRQSPGSVTF